MKIEGDREAERKQRIQRRNVVLSGATEAKGAPLCCGAAEVRMVGVLFPLLGQ